VTRNLTRSVTGTGSTFSYYHHRHQSDLDQEYNAIDAGDTSDDDPSFDMEDINWEIFKQMCEAELAGYQAEEVILSRSMDPLQWWKINHMKYPTLWRLCKIYHAIPATSASSERAFSVSGNIVTQRQCQLATGTVEGMHFLHENGPVLHHEE
jgi:hypothetical protein